MEDQTTRAQAEWQAILEKYPSLKKFEELGDDYVEVRDCSSIIEQEAMLISNSSTTVEKKLFCPLSKTTQMSPNCTTIQPESSQRWMISPTSKTS